MTSTTYAGIVRVSDMGTRKVDAPDFHAERDQIAAMKDAIDKCGGKLEVLASELDTSGGLPLEQRPSLLAAVEGVEAGRYAGIVVAYQSRLGRDVEQEEAVWRRVEQAGGEIIMALDGIDTSTADGRQFRRFRAVMNQGERERHAERFEALRIGATAAGIWQRRQTPRGYRKDDDRNSKTYRHLVPDDEADEVRQAFRDRAAGGEIAPIARRLGMTTSGVRKLLANRVYLGELRVGQHVNESAHEALVGPELWTAAQRSVPRPTRAKGVAPALLAGIARCAGCGHKLTRGGRAALPVYGCPVRHSGGECPEPATVTAALLDAHVEPIALAELECITLTAAEGGGVERARVALANAERERDAFFDAVSAAGIGVESAAAGMRTREDAVHAAREVLDAELSRTTVLPDAMTGAEAYGKLDAHKRNALLRSLLSVVVVKRGGGRGSRTPLADRVRVLRHGARIDLPQRRGGEASGIVPLALPNLSDPDVLRPLVDRKAA